MRNPDTPTNLIRNQNGLAFILEVVVIALTIAVIAIVAIKVQEGRASRVDGVTGGVNQAQPFDNNRPQPTPVDCSVSTQC